MERAPRRDRGWRAIQNARAATVAGIVFSVLFDGFPSSGVGHPVGLDDAGVAHDAVGLDAVVAQPSAAPFAGIVFLWIMGSSVIGSDHMRTVSSPPCSSAAGCSSSATFFVAGAVSAVRPDQHCRRRPPPTESLGSVWPFGRGDRDDAGDGLRPAHGGRVHDLCDDHRSVGSSWCPVGSPCSATRQP